MPLLLAAIIVLVTTFRHEGAHALAARMEGVEVIEMRLFPGIREDVGFYFGYVIRGEGGSWWIDAAPFVAALLWAGLAYVLLRRFPSASSWWLPALFAGVVSPLVDLIYNYQGGLWRQGTDVADLLAILPAVWVHLYFLTAIGLCVILLVCLRHGRTRSGIT